MFRVLMTLVYNTAYLNQKEHRILRLNFGLFVTRTGDGKQLDTKQIFPPFLDRYTAVHFGTGAFQAALCREGTVSLLQADSYSSPVNSLL